MSLIDNPRRCVKLLVDNLLYGNIHIDWNKIDKERQKKYSALLADYAIIPTKRKDSESGQISEVVNELYTFFVGGRFGGSLIGELRDREEEKSLQAIEDQNQRLSEILEKKSLEISTLQKENTRLHDDNVKLASQLEDQQNIINSYENAAGQK